VEIKSNVNSNDHSHTKAEPKIINIINNNNHKMTKEELAIEEFGVGLKSIMMNNSSDTPPPSDRSAMKRWLTKPCSPSDPPVTLSIYPSIYLIICLSIYLTICLSIYQYVYLSLYIYICIFITLSIYLTT
jgi:hypothetical protein